jgi:hypothetical protein
MNKIRPIRELLEFKLDQQFKAVLPILPTVCLVAADTLSPAMDIDAIVDLFVPSGCTFFMTWGEAADELHDAFDYALEERGADFLHVVTTSHKGESVNDVAWFLANSALPGEAKIRCCVFFADETADVAQLISAVRAETAKQ